LNTKKQKGASYLKFHARQAVSSVENICNLIACKDPLRTWRKALSPRICNWHANPLHLSKRRMTAAGVLVFSFGAEMQILADELSPLDVIRAHLC
jgi:hypothetical protein